MAILHSVEMREMVDPLRSPSMWMIPVSSDLSGPAFLEPMHPPTINKIAFRFMMRLYKDPMEERHFRRYNNTEDEWLRHKIHSQIELEDPSGRTFPLDEIFLESHRLPTGLRQGEQVRYHPNEILYYLQNKNFTMYVNMGNDLQPRRVKLINPIITRLDKSIDNNPYPYYPGEDAPDYYRGLSLRGIELDFEILCDSYVEVPHYNEATIRQVLKSVIKKNLTIQIQPTRQEMLTIQASIAEMKARETLRDSISEREWRKYLTNGFIMVLGNSGKWYQVFNKQKHLRVYEGGKFIKELCIHTDTECPPTDHVLNMKIMIECDEQSVWDNSNLYEPKRKIDKIIADGDDNIIDLFSKLKKDRQFLNNRIEQNRQRMEDSFFREYA